MQDETPNPRMRQTRVDREHTVEFQKIELAAHDAEEIVIDTRILNKIKRKMSRRK